MDSENLFDAVDIASSEGSFGPQESSQEQDQSDYFGQTPPQENSLQLYLHQKSESFQEDDSPRGYINSRPFAPNNADDLNFQRSSSSHQRTRNSRRRPNSAKPRRSVNRSMNPDSLVKSVRRALHVSHMGGPRELPGRVKREIRGVVQKKLREMKEIYSQTLLKAPNSAIIRQRTSSENRRKDEKIRRIQEKNTYDDIKRQRLGYEMQKQNAQVVASIHFNQLLHKKANQVKAEDKKMMKDLKIQSSQYKKLIIENISNRFDDQIQEFKDQLSQRRLHQKILLQEKKELQSEAKRMRQQEFRQRLSAKLGRLQKEKEEFMLRLQELDKLQSNLIVKSSYRQLGLVLPAFK